MKRALVLALFATGCSSITPELCRSSNVYERGRAEAYYADPDSQWPEFQKKCGELGVPVDAARFEQGRAEGLRLFCTEKRGYEWGREGKVYHGVCPKDQIADFLRGYKAGVIKYRSEEKERRQAAKIKELEDRITDLEEHQVRSCEFDFDCGALEHCRKNICRE